MIKSSMQIQLILILLISLFTLDLLAKTTTWVGGAGDWDVAASWSDGLPNAFDSAIISGSGSDVVIPGGTFVHIAYVNINNGAMLTIENGGLLEIYNSVTYGIYVQGQGSVVTNRGLLSVSKSGSRGVHVVSNAKVVNEGVITVDSSSYGISLLTEASMENSGEIFIENGFWGIIVVDDSTVENDGLIDVSKCAYSIDIRHVCYFENRDTISIKDGTSIGLVSFGELVNAGSISIQNMEDQADYAMLNDSFGCCDTFYIGKITNSGLIEITNSDSDGLVCKPSTTFFNFGEMHITNCSEMGIVLETLARLRVEIGGELTVSSIGDPLVVEDECDFVVRLGGVFDTSLVDESN